MAKKDVKPGVKAAWGVWLALVLVMASATTSVAGEGQPTAERGTDTAFCAEPALDIGASPPSFKVRLAVSPQTVKVGRPLRLRVENIGANDASYGFSYWLARKEGRSWVKQATGPVFGARAVVRSGTASACQEINLSGRPAPGLYRISKKVRPVDSGLRHEVAVSVTFRVRGS